jgi:hypothetical protein
MLHTIVGKRGRGKTSLAAELIATQHRDRIWIYDYMAEFRGFSIPEFIEVVIPQETGFDQFANQVWEASRVGISTLVVLDEVSSYGRIGSNDHPCLGHFYRLGRHKDIDLISISQRFYSLPPIVRSQSDIFHTFQITELRDRQYLKGLVPPEVLETIIHLDKFKYININL